MEHLDLLEKIYQYGETLSSEEMNQIVSYINIIIDAINSLIRNNNGIRSDHCEMRYKLSPTQPEKPATGTNGLSNGWSDLYLLPEAGSGNSTWMSLCMITGENAYGEWSTPICAHSGTLTGQRGPKGDSGETGAFVSRVFKRQNTKPDRPIGGTYAYPIPDGWYDGVPEGLEIIWSSTCTFYGNGTQTNWSDPAQESDTATLDVEFSPSATQPPAPLGSVPFSNHESEGWYDPNSPNFNSAGIMIWRAERKVSNGEYNGDWTITRIYGEKGDRGLQGESGGHYEFRYKNHISTEEYPAPIKPVAGSDGTSGGWAREQQTLSEIEIKEGTFTWMTQCYVDQGVYGEWTDPIRITGANGIDGEDGTEQEFMYHRNDTGIAPPKPMYTAFNEAALFGDKGYWVDPESGITWTDDPIGVDDIYMWEFVTTRVKEGTIWSDWSTPVLWSKWGKQGKIGQMSYLAGVWDASTTYTKTAERNPVVYYGGNYYYLIGDLEFEGPNKNITEITSQGQRPDLYPNVWAEAESFEMVFTDILFVNDFAKLASFIINKDWMISKNGTLYYSNGQSYDINRDTNLSITNRYGERYTAYNAYLEFDPNYPDRRKANDATNFVPAIAIDSLSGRCFFWKGYFKGDVYATSLHLGNRDIGNELSNTLSSSDVQIISDNGINKTIKVGDHQYEIVNQNNFLLTNIGKTSNDGYFKVDTNGLLEAHNALIYGRIYATDGKFSGEVDATSFTAGDPTGLNIKTTGDTISFNYGGEPRAWFTYKDEQGNDTNGMFLFIKKPDGSGIITIDFANLAFKDVNPVGMAVQQKNIYNNYTDSNYNPNVFTNSANGMYYSNSQLQPSQLCDISNCYEKMEDGYCVVVDSDSKYKIYPASFFTKVRISSGVKNTIDANCYVAFQKNGSMHAAYGAGSSSPLRDYEVYADGGLISNNSHVSMDTSVNYYLAREGTSGGGKITVVTCVSHSGGITYAKKYDVTMHS